MSNSLPSDALSQFRQQQAARFAPGACDGMVGVSPAMQRVRAQIAVSAISGANTLICGHDSTQNGQLAQAIHYTRYPTGEHGLLEIDIEDSLPSQLGRLLQQLSHSEQQATLWIDSIEAMTAEQQLELLVAMRHPQWQSQIVATLTPGDRYNQEEPATGLSDELQAALSTMIIEVPRLADRIEDLPELVAWYLADSVVGTDDAPPQLDQDALDLLLIYPWPGEQVELRQILVEAAGRARGGTITANHLHKKLHHAVDHHALATDRAEPIDLDEYLSQVESTLVTRALELAGNNKAEAARLLGVSRPRLYRKLEQMGLVEPTTAKPKPAEPAAPVETPQETEPKADDIEFLPMDSE